jgi:Protein of unknown function (DUF1580)
VINIMDEQVYPLSQAVEFVPSGRRGGKRNVSTLYRWTTSGCRGVKLEFIMIGATRCTSREALQRFAERSTKGAGADEARVPRTTSARKRAAERAGEELTRMGV